jgi:hypothetical protein
VIDMNKRQLGFKYWIGKDFHIGLTFINGQEYIELCLKKQYFFEKFDLYSWSPDHPLRLI